MDNPKDWDLQVPFVTVSVYPGPFIDGYFDRSAFFIAHVSLRPIYVTDHQSICHNICSGITAILSKGKSSKFTDSIIYYKFINSYYLYSPLKEPIYPYIALLLPFIAQL